MSLLQLQREVVIACVFILGVSVLPKVHGS